MRDNLAVVDNLVVDNLGEDTLAGGIPVEVGTQLLVVEDSLERDRHLAVEDTQLGVFLVGVVEGNLEQDTN